MSRECKYSVEKKNQFELFNNQTDIKLWNFELEYIFSSCKTAILYRKDFDLTKFSNDILIN